MIRTRSQKRAVKDLCGADYTALLLGIQQVQYDCAVDAERDAAEKGKPSPVDFNALRERLQAAHAVAKTTFLEAM